MTENKKMGNLSTPVHSLAALPSVDRLLGVPAIATLGQTHGQSIVVRAIRQILDERRQRFQSASLYAEDLSQERLVQDVEQTLGRLLQPSLRPVINLSGTRSEEHTSELQSRGHLVCRLLLVKKKK